MSLPVGNYEIPLLLQDRTLDAMGQLVYAPTHDDGARIYEEALVLFVLSKVEPEIERVASGSGVPRARIQFV
jgi:hypothetical protein